MRNVAEMLREKKVAAEDIQEYQGWRAKKALLLIGRYGTAGTKQRVNTLTESLLESLKPFVTRRRSSMFEDLLYLVTEAGRLDEEFYKSRAIFELRGVNNGTRKRENVTDFNPNTMDGEIGFEEVENGWSLELVTSPMLVKIGNADGFDYHSEMMIAKLHVMCAQTRRKVDRKLVLKS